ncbi:hypothetical protein KBC86_01725 [Candidatus Gracilibacteria bacterium]|nr:hypothetical protein [Candidatus Gracilibacteria bacterium]
MALLLLSACSTTQNQSTNVPTKDIAPTPATQSGAKMSFFITSVNPGNGGNLGGLAGADAYCQKLASAVGAGDKTWRAYLSTTASDGTPAVNARDRIGKGPWYNVAGDLIAENLESLHGVNAITKTSALDEKGNKIFGRGDEINNHDILTGSLPDGTASGSTIDTTCGNWTTGSGGSAIVGHHDRIGINDSEPMKSWNSSHGSRGCSLDQLRMSGGAGLFYCFAE